MKVISLKGKLYAIQSAALQIPVFQHTKENAGAHTDPESCELARYTDVTTTRYQLMIPWLSVTKFNPAPSGLEELFNLAEEEE